jgi:hypothetical protein|eukprot:COSAG02_NODE_783_length_17238_cov_173.774199_10_plen_54_part_00
MGSLSSEPERLKLTRAISRLLYPLPIVDKRIAMIHSAVIFTIMHAEDLSRAVH